MNYGYNKPSITENQQLKDQYLKLKSEFDQTKLELNGIKLKYNQTKIKLDQFKSEAEEEKSQLRLSNRRLKSELNQERAKNLELTKELQTGLLGDLKTCIEDEATKDFKITIENREFPVHKLLLIARCPTLAEILQNNPEIENLNLVDIPVDIFEIILKFIYTDELPENDETNFLHLFAAAGKLKIKQVKEFAATKIYETIDQDNALEVFKLSCKYEHDLLRQKSFTEIQKMFPKYEFKDTWASNYEFIIEVIEEFKKYEEAIKKLEDKFNI